MSTTWQAIKEVRGNVAPRWTPRLKIRDFRGGHANQHIRFRRTRPAKPLKFVFLRNAQIWLAGQDSLSDFVEEGSTPP